MSGDLVTHCATLGTVRGSLLYLRLVVLGLAPTLLASCLSEPTGRSRDASLSDSATGDGAMNTDAGSATNFVFVTSMTYTADVVGGLGGADAICASHASDAGLPGRYLAYLSTADSNAGDRLSPARGWVRRDGRPFVDTVADMHAGEVFYPVVFDEAGAAGPARIHTGTTAVGAYDTLNDQCNDFTEQTAGGRVTVGSTNVTTGFAATGVATCQTPLALLCFGVDHAREVAPLPPSTRIAFLSAPFTPGEGIIAATVQCMIEGDALVPEGTFVPLLPTESTPVPTETLPQGAGWVRPDGAEIVANARDLAGPWLTSINLAADGTYHSDATRVWTGASGPETASTSHCDDWTTTGGQALTAPAATPFSDGSWAVPRMCSSSLRLFCLQID